MGCEARVVALELQIDMVLAPEKVKFPLQRLSVKLVAITDRWPEREHHDSQPQLVQQGVEHSVPGKWIPLTVRTGGGVWSALKRSKNPRIDSPRSLGALRFI